MWFIVLTQNTAPIHFDRHYAAQTEFGKPLVDSTFTLALPGYGHTRTIPCGVRTFSRQLSMFDPVLKGRIISSATPRLKGRGLVVGS